MLGLSSGDADGVAMGTDVALGEHPAALDTSCSRRDCAMRGETHCCPRPPSPTLLDVQSAVLHQLSTERKLRHGA